MSFVHLQVHSQYSLLQSTCTFDEICKRAVEEKMPALAVTDYGNMFGAIEFYLAARKYGIKPIIGLEVFVAPSSRFEKTPLKNNPNHHLVLLATDYKAYQNLCKISSIGYQEGFYYVPRVDYETLKKYREGLIVLTGGFNGEVYQFYSRLGEKAAEEKIKKLQNLFGDKLYLQINRMSTPIHEEVNPFIIEASKKFSIPLVAANNIHYSSQSKRIAQEALICIGSNKTLQDESRYKLGSSEYYFKGSQQMRDLFKDLPEACDNTLKVAELCNVEFKMTNDKGEPIYHLPSFPTESGCSLKQDMKNKSEVGLSRRFKESELRNEEIKDQDKYRNRLAHELEIIDKMGFNGYFLIVQDFINWAKQRDIPVGPGRGSGAGSLVAYSLNITDLDPMPYNLLFERFLNPERVSMPDFDIDFCQECRGDVIQYVIKKYGKKSVSQIITYGKLQARAAIRDVGRVLGMTYAEVDTVAKLMPDILGITLKEALDLEPKFQEMMEADPSVNSLINLALQVEGLVRHAGIHAAGVIISDGDIGSHAPLYKGADDENIVQFDMKHIEKIGLIKFDFLGLKTLTHISEALRLIEKNRGKKISTKDISLSDPGIYKLLCNGDTAGIFQLEGEGMSDLIRKVQPKNFEDIVAINALYRPGPMEMIPEYINRRSGKSRVTYDFPELEEITKETLGIVIYQEQVQLIASQIASYSLGEADILRRAMGKKIKEEMDQQRERFVSGAEKNNFNKKKSEKLFDSMAEFAKYGFNKSHAAAYCMIAAQTAFIKYYYPVEFFAALLSTDMKDTTKVAKYIRDTRNHGIEVRPPHINYSNYKFSVEGDVIFFSMAAVKGVGSAAVAAIIEARDKMPNKKFETLEDFFFNVDLRKANKTTVESLIKAGAFDGYGFHRNQLFKGFSSYVSEAERVRFNKEVGQTSLFDTNEETKQENHVVLKSCPEWSRSILLAQEKEVLGFYLSGHPLSGLEDLVESCTTKICDLQEKEEKTSQRVIGLVSSLREIITKKGDHMAFVQLEDSSENLDLVLFPKIFSKYEALFKSNEPLIVTGKLDLKGSDCKLIVEKAERLSQTFTQVKRLVFHIDNSNQDRMEDLKKILSEYRGDVDSFLSLNLQDTNQFVEMRLDDSINPNIEMFEKIYGVFGSIDFVEVSF